MIHKYICWCDMGSMKILFEGGSCFFDNGDVTKHDVEIVKSMNEEQQILFFSELGFVIEETETLTAQAFLAKYNEIIREALNDYIKWWDEDEEQRKLILSCLSDMRNLE